MNVATEAKAFISPTMTAISMGSAAIEGLSRQYGKASAIEGDGHGGIVMRFANATVSVDRDGGLTRDEHEPERWDGQS